MSANETFIRQYLTDAFEKASLEYDRAIADLSAPQPIESDEYYEAALALQATRKAIT